MTPKERQQLKLAQQLLSIALNGNASNNGHQMAYSCVAAIMEYLNAIMEYLKITPPKQALVEIESKNRILLEA